jgi:hypothetical protein
MASTITQITNILLHYLRLDALILPMIHRPQIRGRFHGAESPLHLKKLLVSQGDV